MDFVGKRRWFFLLSGILIIAGIISILIPPAFRFGIEFTGGTVLTLTFEDSVEQESLSSLMSDLGHKEAVIQKLGDKSFLVRTKTLQEPIQENEPSEREQIEEAIKDTKIFNREKYFINEFNNETKVIERVSFFSMVVRSGKRSSPR